MIARFKPDAYALDAVIDAGVPYAIAKTLLVDGPRAVAERPRLSTRGRKRGDPTTVYVWGPDANALLTDRGR